MENHLTRKNLTSEGERRRGQRGTPPTTTAWRYAKQTRWVRWTSGLALMTCLTMSGGFPGSAQAQSESDRANARAAATAGADAFDAQDFAKAADLFSRAESLLHSQVHLWYIARSAEKLGQLIRAQESCVTVQREGLPSGASRGIVAAVEGCATLLQDLQGRIPTLTVDVVGATQDKPYRVFRNGKEVPSAILGIPAPVDPGEQVLTVESEDYQQLEQRLTVAEGARETVQLSLTLAAPVATAAVTAEEPQPTTAPNDSTPSDSTPNDTAGGLMPPRWPSYVAWGVGLGGIGVGVAFGLMAQDEANRSDALCGEGGRGACDPQISAADLAAAQAANDAAGTNQMISIIGYSAGGVALATGLVLWLVQPRKGSSASAMTNPAPQARPTLQPIVGFGHVGVTGTF